MHIELIDKSKALRRARDGQLTRCIPDLFAYHTLLYIGCKLRWNYPTFRGQDGFDSAGYAIDVIELLSKNVIRLREANNQGHRFLNGFRESGMFRNIYEGDVRDTLETVSQDYDIVMWWQGPEHLPLDDLPKALGDLYSITKKILILGCPCNKITTVHPIVKIEKFKPKPGQRQIGISAHLSILSPDYFEHHGFEVDVVGECGVKGNNMLAFKRKR